MAPIICANCHHDPADRTPQGCRPGHQTWPGLNIVCDCPELVEVSIQSL